MTTKRKRSTDSLIEGNEFTDTAEETTDNPLEVKEEEEEITEAREESTSKLVPKRKIRVLNLNRPHSDNPVRNTPKFSPLR